MPIIRSLPTAVATYGFTYCHKRYCFVKPQAATAVDKLLMMGMRMHETC
jgi:hypothetical protein